MERVKKALFLFIVVLVVIGCLAACQINISEMTTNIDTEETTSRTESESTEAIVIVVETTDETTSESESLTTIEQTTEVSSEETTELITTESEIITTSEQITTTEDTAESSFVETETVSETETETETTVEITTETETESETTEITETTDATTTEEPIETTEETTTPEETTTEEPVQLFTLTVYYVYKNGGTASETHVEHLPYNSNYNVSSPVISGYSVDKATVSGKLTKNTSVTVTYTKITMYSLTIYYSDYDTAATLSQSHYELLPSGSQYSVDSPVIEGYDIQVASNATISGTLTSDYEVTVWYVKKQSGQGQGQETPTEKEEQYFLVKLDATKEEYTSSNGFTTKYIKVKDKNNNDVTVELKIRGQGKLRNVQWIKDHGGTVGTAKNQIDFFQNTRPLSDEEKNDMKESADAVGKTITSAPYYDLLYAYSIKYGNVWLTGSDTNNHIIDYRTKNETHPELVYKGGENITVELKIYLIDTQGNIIQTVYDNPNYVIHCASSLSDYSNS